VTRRAIPDTRETGQVVLAQQAYGLLFALVLVGAFALLGQPVTPTQVTPLGLSSAALSGALYYAGAYWLYLGALRRVPASVAAGSFYLIPIVGVAAGAVVLDERLTVIQWIGAGLVLASVLGILVRSMPAGRRIVLATPRS
jgi:drug/metabolite transporter (DMT)-like permease